jgi:RNA polymerase-binding transcription factor DksA
LAGDNAVQEQIDATIKDGIRRARSQLPQGPGLRHCEECDVEIPELRRKAVPACACAWPARKRTTPSRRAMPGTTVRGSKDSQLR